MSHTGHTAFSQTAPHYPLTTTWHRRLQEGLAGWRSRPSAPCPAPSTGWRPRQPASHTEEGGSAPQQTTGRKHLQGVAPARTSHARFPPHPPGSAARVRHSASFPRRGQQDSSWLGTQRPKIRAKTKCSGGQMSARPLVSLCDLRLDTLGSPLLSQKSKLPDRSVVLCLQCWFPGSRSP